MTIFSLNYIFVICPFLGLKKLCLLHLDVACTAVSIPLALFFFTMAAPVEIRTT